MLRATVVDRAHRYRELLAIGLNPVDGAGPARPHRMGFPMMPGRFPRLGHLPALTWDMPALLEWGVERCGPSFWIDRGFGSEVLQLTDAASFSMFRNKTTDSSFHEEAAGALLGRSMIVLDGPEHKRVRGATTSAFSPVGLDRAAVGQVIAEVARRRVEAWAGPWSEKRVPIAREMRELALEVIFLIIGIELSDVPAWRHHYEELLLSAINIPFDFPGSPQRRGWKAEAWLEREMGEIVDRAEREADTSSLLGAMVHGRDEHGRGLSRDELIANARLLVFAGHETTASVLAWAFVHLASAPPVWDELVEEATALGGAVVDFHQMTRAKIAEAVFRETLRLYPPVINDVRRVRGPYEVEGRPIEVGTVIGCSIHHLSRDPGRYPHPDQWRPHRWLGLDRRPNALEMCQFGGGPHFCLGYHVAMLEGVAVLLAAAHALSRWGARPRFTGTMPRPRFLPIQHPPRNLILQIRRGPR
ncbi:MAG: cytochrome P450 [Myxococcota bacterium]